VQPDRQRDEGGYGPPSHARLAKQPKDLRGAGAAAATTTTEPSTAHGSADPPGTFPKRSGAVKSGRWPEQASHRVVRGNRTRRDGGVPRGELARVSSGISPIREFVRLPPSGNSVLCMAGAVSQTLRHRAMRRLSLKNSS